MSVKVEAGVLTEGPRNEAGCKALRVTMEIHQHAEAEHEYIHSKAYQESMRRRLWSPSQRSSLSAIEIGDILGPARVGAI